MYDIKVGDNVYITDIGDQDLTGEVIAEGSMPWSDGQDTLSNKESETIYWWKVQIDRTGEIKDIPALRLRCMSIPKQGDNIRLIDREDRGKTGIIISSILNGEVKDWVIEYEDRQTIVGKYKFEILPPE